MVGEAYAHVQGESLKADAALLTEASQLPDHQSGAMMRVFSKLILVGCLTLSGCLTYQPEQLNAAINQGELHCAATTWPTMASQVHCLDEEESAAWLMYAPPKYLPFFEDERVKRDQLAAQFDARQLTKEQVYAQFAAYKQEVASKLQQQINIDVAANQINQQQTARLTEALGDALIEYGQIRSAQIANTQHTNCQMVFQQLQCTTTSGY
jgi:hypothetical protein